MDRQAGYHEFEPADGCFSGHGILWSYRPLQGTTHRVLPDGCCDLVLRVRFDDGGRIETSEPIVAGAATAAQIVPFEHNTAFAGIRLKAGVLRRLLDIDAASIAGLTLGGNSALTLSPELVTICKPARTLLDVVCQLHAFVDRKVTDCPPREAQQRAMSVLDLVRTSGGKIGIADLADAHGVDERTVRRDIIASTGLNPKSYAMIHRFHRALRLIRIDRLALGDVAVEAGYADQAHLTRAFRRIAGVTPGDAADITLVTLPG